MGTLLVCCGFVTWIRSGHTKVIPSSATTFIEFRISSFTFSMTKEWSQAILSLKLLQIKEEFYALKLHGCFSVQAFQQGVPPPSNDVDTCQDGT